MRLTLVLAGGADLFPQEGDCVQAHDIGALVGPKQDDVEDLDEDRRIAVVEVPLVGVEHGHHPLAHCLVEREVAGCGLREYLGHGLLEHVRDVTVIKDVVVVLVLCISLSRLLCPLVLVRCVVDHHVKGQKDVSAPHRAAELTQLVHCADALVDVAKVTDRIAAVACALGTLENRHDVDHVHTEFLQVAEA